MPKPRFARMITAGFIVAVCTSPLAARPAGAPLVAHEWGTFTALQADDGRALGAINADDEPVPDFVCRFGGVRISAANSQLTPYLEGGKGLMPCHPGVTMRLETPVIYFYPPENGRSAPVKVRVKFQGGWLTEFYPRAVPDAPDLSGAQVAYPPLAPTTSGSLAWNQVKIGAIGKPTVTTDPVWTTPREVARAALVQVPDSPDDGFDANHPEKFLFYRGVGHLDSPLRVVRDPNTDVLSLHADLSALRLPEGGAQSLDLRVPAAWLIEIRPEDGFCAFRPVFGGMDLHAPAGRPMASVPASFSPAEFGPDRLQELRGAMRDALVANGLFPDEAAAMLKTWELSYFESPGRRLFYVTPRAWTDGVLPLEIDGATITRVMVGRIELVTPAQHALLARVAAGPCPDMPAFTKACWEGVNASATAWSKRTHNGQDAAGQPWKRPTFAEMKIAVPLLYQDYLNLGRFRDALVLDEEQRQPTPALRAFIAGNGLQAREASTALTLSSFLPGDEHAR